MFNKELLLSGGRVDAEPHVIMTIDHTMDNLFIYWGYNEGTSAINRKPYWIKGSGNKLTLSLLADCSGKKPIFYGTALTFKNGYSYFTSEDSFRLTRADTKEVIELVKGDSSLITFYTQKTTTPFFHDLNQGDSVGVFFDPPPDGYL